MEDCDPGFKRLVVSPPCSFSLSDQGGLLANYKASRGGGKEDLFP